MKSEPFFETVTDRFCGQILTSVIRKATEEDILSAELLHKQGNCPHNIIVDEHFYMYDARKCFTCGAGLGII